MPEVCNVVTVLLNFIVMPSSRKFCQLLARVNFPPYTVHCLTERHILVAGGGGSAKTGIRNVIEIYELINDATGCRAKSVAHYETGTQAIMNCAILNAANFFVLFAGMEGMCQLYKLKFKMQEVEQVPNGIIKELNSGTLQSSVVARKSKVTESKNSDENSSGQKKFGSGENSSRKGSSAPVDLVLDIKPLQFFQTDFSADPFQKLARFSLSSKILATAGSDGHIRVWQYPEMTKVYEIHAHEDDVDDLDFSPLGDKIVSVSRDGHGKIWNSEDGSLVCDLQYDLPHKSQSKYTYRGCRFAVVEGDKASAALFITLNPSVRKKPPSPSFLSKWNGTTYSIEKIVSAGQEMLSAIAVSTDGHFIGLGTQEGSVRIYIAFSLQLLHRTDHVHSIFVTGLEFLPSCAVSRRITGGHEASLISISVDNHINVHYIPNRATIGAFSIVIMFTAILFFIFILMDYFSL